MPTDGLTPILPPDTPDVGRRRMLMSVGAKVRRDILEAGFANDVDSPWTLHVQEALRNPLEERLRGWASQAIIEAEPAAWEVLGRWLSAQAARSRFGAPAVAVERARAFGHLGLRISRELDRLARHPAYQGKAVLGVEPIVLACYRVGDVLGPTPERTMMASGWADDPLLEGDLWPYAATKGTQTFTVWLWESSIPAHSPLA